MNNTTGVVATALSIACLVSAERNLAVMGETLGAKEKFETGRAARRKA